MENINSPFHLERAQRAEKVVVGAIIDRPRILLRKIHRRKAKIVLFSFGKFEKLCFSAGDQ